MQIFHLFLQSLILMIEISNNFLHLWNFEDLYSLLYLLTGQYLWVIEGIRVIGDPGLRLWGLHIVIVNIIIIY